MAGTSGQVISGPRPTTVGCRPVHPLEVAVGTQDLGDDEGPALVLVVLEEEHEGPAHGAGGAVEGVDEARPPALAGAEAGARPAGGKIRVVRARRDLAVAPLGGEPHLDVVLLGRR